MLVASRSSGSIRLVRLGTVEAALMLIVEKPQITPDALFVYWISTTSERNGCSRPAGLRPNDQAPFTSGFR